MIIDKIKVNENNTISFNEQNDKRYVKIKPGVNLFNIDDSDIMIGKFLYYSSLESNDLIYNVNASLAISGYIPIEPGQILYVNFKEPYGTNVFNVLFDENYEPINEYKTNAYGQCIEYPTDYAFTRTPKYARISLLYNPDTFEDTIIRVGEIQGNEEKYNPIDGYLTNLKDKVTSLDQNAIVNRTIELGSNNKNLLNKFAVGYKEHYHFNSQGSETYLPSFDNLALSNYIPISNGMILKANTYYGESDPSHGYMGAVLYDKYLNILNVVSINVQNYLIGTENSYYARFTLYGQSNMNYTIQEVNSINDEIVYDGEYSPIANYTTNITDSITELNTSITRLEAYKNKRTIVCDGDSLTWGDLGQYYSNEQAVDNFPQTLQNLLGDNFLVVNSGVPGAPSASIVGNATGFVITESVTIPAAANSTVYIKCHMAGDITDIISWTFTPVISHHDARGDINPAYINGVKGTLGYTKQNDVYVATFTRTESGQAVTAEQGTMIFTKEMSAYLNCDRIVFIGANGGWKKDDTSDSQQNIDEFIRQNNMIISNSNSRYIIMSYYGLAGTNSRVWPGEARCLQEYGSHYINLREYFSTDAINDGLKYGYIQEAIDSGDLEDTTYPTSVDTSRMQSGSVPQTCLTPDGVHLKNWAYKVLGMKVYKKYQELIKEEILN